MAAFETLEDNYRWDPGLNHRFVLLEPDPPQLVQVEPERTAVMAQRVHEGWTLMTTVQSEENAQLRITDVWIRNDGPPAADQN